jgi:hypothetical protein
VPEWIERLLEAIADLPFGLGGVGRLLAEKNTTRAQSYDLTLVFVFSAVYLIEAILCACGVLSLPLAQHFLLVIGIAVLSFGLPAVELIFSLRKEQSERDD